MERGCVGWTRHDVSGEWGMSDVRDMMCLMYETWHVIMILQKWDNVQDVWCVDDSMTIGTFITNMVLKWESLGWLLTNTICRHYNKIPRDKMGNVISNTHNLGKNGT